MKKTGNTLDESLSRALDFLTFSNKITFITYFDFVELRVQNAKETEIDTALSEQALLLFMETKGNKRFENETENLGKIWPGIIHLPNLIYTVHPVILSTECLLVSIQFKDKHNTPVSVKDIKQYIEAVLLGGEGERSDRAITQLDVKEDILEIKGRVNERGKYILMAFIANVPLRKSGFTIKTDITEEQQHFVDEVDSMDTENLIETTDVVDKQSYIHTADAVSKEQLIKKADLVDSDIEQSESADNKSIFGKGDSYSKESMAGTEDAIDKELFDEKADSTDKGPKSLKGAAGGKEHWIGEGYTLDKPPWMETSMTGIY